MRNVILPLMAAIFLFGCSPNSSTDSDTTSSSNDSEQSIIVETQDAFKDAVANATPGDRIVLADGEWKDFDLLLEGEGDEENPIELTAETPGKVILTGQSSLRLGGKHLRVSGLVFKDGFTPRNEVISFRKDKETFAYNSQVTNVVIDGFSNPNRTQRDLWVGMYGKNNVFDYNHLSGKMNAGPTFAVRLNSPESLENNHRIANNYFGPRPVFGSNGGETFRIGTSHFSLERSNTVVENNYFDRCSGEVEIISSKSGGNVLRGNTFFESRGTLTLRHGNGTTVENNLFDGNGKPYTGGVRVINAQQTIRNNFFKDLTGNRFSGALVIMNGVPNSPINRYHQVDGAVVENNTFQNVRAIELGEGSDAERTAVPVNSIFRNNAIQGSGENSPFQLYDDMSGIDFSDNTATQSVPATMEGGFNISGEVNAPSGAFGVAREETGVDWYEKPGFASPFDGGREISLKPGNDVLFEALKTAEPGDTFILAPGNFSESRAISVEVPITVKGSGGDKPFITFDRPNLFVLTASGALSLSNLHVSGTTAPDGSGNAFVSTSPRKGSGNHVLLIENSVFSDFDVNRGFSVLSAGKGSFFDNVEITNSKFENISGTVFKLNQETDDFGIYNAEYLTISGSEFENIGGPIADIYRGGRDESTFGPHANIDTSTFKSVGTKGLPLMVLHGIQQGSFVDNKIEDSDPMTITITTGLPVIDFSGNSMDGQSSDDIAKTTDLRKRK